MTQTIEPGFMVFIGEGSSGVAAVREVRPGGLLIYVENAGEFAVPASAIRSVHDGKVVLAPEKLESGLIRAIRHEHDREDPDVAG